MDNPDGVFTHGEESQLAEATLSLVRRPDFDGAAFAAMTDGFLQRRSRSGRAGSTPGASPRSRTRSTSCAVSTCSWPWWPRPKPSPALAPTQAKILACLPAM